MSQAIGLLCNVHRRESLNEIYRNEKEVEVTKTEMGERYYVFPGKIEVVKPG